MKSLAVFCSSSDDIDPVFFAAAKQLGELMATHEYRLVYGGSKIGLMGAVASSIKCHGGQTLGISPEVLNHKDVVNTIDDELIITKGMRERKALMSEKSDAFMCLPGGFGTFEEVFEILTQKQLGYHNKAIIFLNINGYYDKLLDMFEHMFASGFAKQEYRQLYHIANKVEDTMIYLNDYQPPDLPDEWYI